MTAMNITTDNILQEIHELHNGIMLAARRSVHDAIRIGQLLSLQKEKMKHGEFLPWVSELPFTDKTAEKYIKLYKYQYKIELDTNLQDAYHMVEQIEYQEKQSEEERKRAIIAEYRKTGKKAEGWDRSFDYIIKKDEEADRKYREQQERVKQEQAERDNKAKEREQERVKFDEKIKNENEFLDALRKSQQRDREDEELKKKLRLSSRQDNITQEIMFEELDKYLASISDKQRRIETAQNIIKYLRNAIIKMQKL